MKLSTIALSASLIAGSAVYCITSVFSPHGSCVEAAAQQLASAEYGELQDRANHAAQILCDRNGDDAAKAVDSLKWTYR